MAMFRFPPGPARSWWKGIAVDFPLEGICGRCKGFGRGTKDDIEPFRGLADEVIGGFETRITERDDVPEVCFTRDFRCGQPELRVISLLIHDSERERRPTI